MTEKHFWELTMNRKNWIGMAFLGFFYNISSPFRLLIEVHVREGFGYRYMSLFTTLCVTTVLVALPYMHHNAHPEEGMAALLGEFITWYAFVALFVFKSIRHYLENRKRPGVFVMNKHTLHSGSYHPLFYKLEDYGLTVNPRTISIYYEPGLFFIMGILLALLSQPIGWVLIVSSIVYSLGYLSSFKNGDEHLANLFDSRLQAHEMQSVAQSGRKPQTGTGFEMFDWPADPTLSQQVAESMRVQTEVLDAY